MLENSTKYSFVLLELVNDDDDNDDKAANVNPWAPVLDVIPSANFELYF